MSYQDSNAYAATYNLADHASFVDVRGEVGVTLKVGTLSVNVLSVDASGNVRVCTGVAVPTDTDAGYATGALFINTAGGAGATLYVNEGSATSASFRALDTADAPSMLYYSIAATTTGTTPVNVFGAGGAPTALTVTSVLSIAQDTTVSNISLKQATNTVVTIAKGTTAGGVVGGVSLTSTVYAAGDACQIVSSATGNSTVVITFTI